MSAVVALPVYLGSYLEPLQPFLCRGDVTDVYVNRPGEIWVETLEGKSERHEVASLSGVVLDRLARQIAALNHQGINREHPLLSATLPDGSRVQVIAPPATRGNLALAIRKHLARGMTLDDYAQLKAFEGMQQGGDEDADAELASLRNRGDHTALLRLAVRKRRNILVSGGTATGKTTFLNALLQEIPLRERLVLIEDTAELAIPHENHIGLIAARSRLGEASINAEDLLNASLRMRPDRIILGELRGPEAFTFLRAVNTGHPGSMTSIHADSPDRAIEQIALLVLQTGVKLDHDVITRYVRSTIDVYVHLDRVSGRRFVSQIGLRQPT